MAESLYSAIGTSLGDTFSFIEELIVSKGHGTGIAGSFLASELLQLHTTTGFSDTFSPTDSASVNTGKGFSDTTALDSSLLSLVGKGLGDSFLLSEVVVVDLLRGLILGDSALLNDSLGIDFNRATITENIGITDSFSVIIGKNIEDVSVLTDIGIDKDLSIVKTDDLVISHTTGDVLIEGLQDRKLGGEPFNNITFN
jgi:hypothetical protein